MKKWNLIIDIGKCEDCNNCFLACKDEHVDNLFPGYTLSQPRHGHRWINIMRKERGQYPLIDVAYLPIPCMHCDKAPCMGAAKDDAVYKRDDGIVMIDPKKAKGQKDLIRSCPYEAIWWNEEKEVPQKCTFCAHLLDEGWKVPRCVQVCPTGALKVVHAEDPEMGRMAETLKLVPLNPRLQTQPRVYYKNLYRYEKCFIGGSVAYQHNGIIDCARDAEVTLVKNGRHVVKMGTDAFGDFKFDNLEENSGSYTLEIGYLNYEKRAIEIDLKQSINIGTVLLKIST